MGYSHAMSNLSDSRIGSDYTSLHKRNLELMRQVDHLSTLREIGLAISASLELRETLPLIVKVLQGAVDVRRVTIYEYREEEERFQPIVAKYGQDLITSERLEEESVSSKGTALGAAIAERRVVLDEVDGLHAAFVPLLAKHRPLGVLALEGPTSDEAFDDDDAALFQEIGSQVAIAIQNNQLYALAVNDGLTGLFVRRYFDLQLNDLFAKAVRYTRPFALLMFDIDHFKQFNDTHGHQTGDRVLQQFAKLLRQNTRESDIVCRYGGEEMAVLLPETGEDEALMLANKLCKRVRENVFQGNAGQELKVTTSIGVAGFGITFATPEEMLKACDDALYEAKRNGRNRVEMVG
jgi:diguanylate cyclase (GGDEF)-like protein